MNIETLFRDRIVGLHDNRGKLTITFQTTPTGKELAVAIAAWEFVGEHKANVAWDIAVVLEASQ